MVPGVRGLGPHGDHATETHPAGTWPSCSQLSFTHEPAMTP